MQKAKQRPIRPAGSAPSTVTAGRAAQTAHFIVRKVDEIAREAFSEYVAAAERLKAAEAKKKEYPQRRGLVDAAYMAKSTRAEADVLEAKEAIKAAKKRLESHADDLAAQLGDAYSVDPAQLDGATLELLKSGILTANEYSKLLHEAQEKGNVTMIRLIGKYAADAADELTAKYGQSDSTARALRLVSHESRQSSGDELLKTFDYLGDVYGRSISNPAMINHWGELTAAAIENF